MESFWKGIFDPRFAKHRDFEHASFAEHEFENGATYDIQLEWAMLETNPVNFDLLIPSRRYYAVDIALHSHRSYRYWVPAAPGGVRPSEQSIKRTMNDYASLPVPGGRDWQECIDTTETPEEHLRSLVRSYEDNPRLQRK